MCINLNRYETSTTNNFECTGNYSNNDRLNFMRITDIDEFVPQDFRVRRRLPTIIQFAIIAVILLVILTGFFYLFAESAFFIPATAFLLLLHGGVCAFWFQRNYDLLTATEFTNALLAASMNTGFTFSIIVRTDGLVMYFSPAIRSLLPNFFDNIEQTLETFCEDAGLSVEEENTIYKALKKNETFSMVVFFPEQTGEKKPYRISIDPIRRPSNHFLIRGRPYIENRTEAIR